MSPSTPLAQLLPDAALLINEAVDVLRTLIRDTTATPETRRRAAASLLHFLLPRPSARAQKTSDGATDSDAAPAEKSVNPSSPWEGGTVEEALRLDRVGVPHAPPTGDGGTVTRATPVTHSEPTASAVVLRLEAIRGANGGCQTPQIRARSASDGLSVPCAGPVTDSLMPPRATAVSESHRALADQPPVAPDSSDAPSVPTRPLARPRWHGHPSSEPDSRLAIGDSLSCPLGLAFPHRASTAASRLVAAAGSARSLDTS